jgi:hypothetical protein
VVNKPLRLSDLLANTLQASHDVSADVVWALSCAVVAANDGGPDARAYAGAMDLSYFEFGIAGVKYQTAYLLMYLSHWRGPEAAAMKKLLRKWSSAS